MDLSQYCSTWDYTNKWETLNKPKWYRYIETNTYADDIVVNVRAREASFERYGTLKEDHRSLGWNQTQRWPEYKQWWIQYNWVRTMIEDDIIIMVSGFTNLGSKVNRTNNVTRERRQRIVKGTETFYVLHSLQVIPSFEKYQNCRKFIWSPAKTNCYLQV